MLGWVAWELWGTNIGVRAEYDEQIKDLEQTWANQDPAADPSAATDPAAVDPSATSEDQTGTGDDVAQQVTDPLRQYNLGTGFAILSIPKISLRAPIIAGTAESALSRGVGWVESSQMPGEAGNVAIAGHHSSHGHPFDNLQELSAGDEFTIETADMIYTYRLLNSPADVTVDFHETWVTEPDAVNQAIQKGLITATPTTDKFATLLTCREYFSTPLRSIGFAEEISETPK